MQLNNRSITQRPQMCLFGQPAPKVRLAASSNRDGNEWTWVVNQQRGWWDERMCD